MFQPVMIVAFVVPCVVLLGSLYVRAHETKQFPPSAAADWLLLLVVLDITVIRESERFTALIHDEWLRAHAVDCFVVLMLVSAFFWYVMAASIEPRLVSGQVRTWAWL